MAERLLSDDIWLVVEPLLPPARPKPQGGRPPISNRAALTGILFVLKTGLPFRPLRGLSLRGIAARWEYLPAEMGCGSGMSCWRRLRDWQEAGVWAALHRVLLERLEQAGRLDWSRAALDSATVAAKRGDRRRGRTPRTGASQAPNATSWSMPEERRSVSS